MHNFAMFNYDYLFGDHFAKVSAKAKLLYINLSFFANAGFVPNPKQVCKNLGYEEEILDELISINEVLTLPNRTEVFLTSYFIHNANFNPLSWTKTPFATYWKGKLWMKRNRIATFSKEKAMASMKEDDKDKIMNDPQMQPNSAKPNSVFDELESMVKVAQEDEQDLQVKIANALRKQRNKEPLTLEDNHYIYLYYQKQQGLI